MADPTYEVLLVSQVLVWCLKNGTHQLESHQAVRTEDIKAVDCERLTGKKRVSRLRDYQL